MMVRRYWIYVVMIFLYGASALAQEVGVESGEKDSLVRVFHLGEVRISGTKPDPFRLSVNREDMRKMGGSNPAVLLDRLPGMHMIYAGQKNEAMVDVRGFDLRQVPVYLDGVPVYVSYDGFADLGRFLSPNLGRITVSRAGTSLLGGPNALGGAINLVGRVPVKVFELEAASGFMVDRRGLGGLQSDISLGSLGDKYYLQLDLSLLDRQDQVLPGSDSLVGDRELWVLPNTGQQDMNLSVRAGYTPNPTDSYVFSYHFHDGNKGVASYDGDSPYERARYWRFPQVRKHGVHLNTYTALGSKGRIRTRAYVDTYSSILESYDDSTFTSRNFASSFTSIYEDLSMGASVIYGAQVLEKHDLDLALHLIHDQHREYNSFPVEETPRNFRDLSMSVALEDEARITRRLLARIGIGYQHRVNLQADDYDAPADSVFAFPGHRDGAPNLLVGMRWDLSERQYLAWNLSRKSRLPSMKDRYSYRLGRSLPNPGLVSERAWNADLSYDFRLEGRLHFTTSLFYSRLDHSIQEVYGIDPSDPSLYQFRNTGRARFYGWEAELMLEPLRGLELGSSYTLLKRENLDHPEIYFTDVPEHKLYTQVNYSLAEMMLFHLGIRYNSERLRTSDGFYVADPYSTVDFRMVFKLEYLDFEVGVNNLLDATYSYMEGYLAPGRQMHMGFRYRIAR